MQFKGTNLLTFVPDFTVIDMECTGRSDQPHDITEMSAIKYRNYKPVSSFSILVKAKNEILPYVEELTGIKDDMLVDEKPIEDVIETFSSFIGTDVVLGHNVAFDFGLINKALLLIGKDEMHNNYIDTLRLSRIINQDSKNHKLETLCSYFGIERNVGHRAEHDCLQTAQLYIQMKKKYQIITGGYSL